MGTNKCKLTRIMIIMTLTIYYYIHVVFFKKILHLVILPYIFTFQISNFESVPTYFSQCEEDKYLLQQFFSRSKNGKSLALRNGTYWEIGAYDGVAWSNTLMFEKSFQWNGILVEGSPRNFKALVKNRRGNILVGKAICEKGKRYVEFLTHHVVGGIVNVNDTEIMEHHKTWTWNERPNQKTIRVECITVNEILRETRVRQIDLLSVDMEGGEYDFLKQFPFQNIAVGVVIVEKHHEEKIHNLMEKKHGFHYYAGIQKTVDENTIENLVFVKEDYLNALNESFEELL